MTDSQLWANVGYIVAAGASIAGGIAGGMKLRQLFVARIDRGVAQEGADRQVADANSEVYRRMIERLADAEKEIRSMQADHRAMRQEIDALRRQIRHNDDHIALLERTMRAHGIDPPRYEPLRMLEQ